ncbi:serine/threonine protein kinase [Pseudenhygromyxa sp. WMMC2535]|uniref:serine/threonine protein kinase n=1 Tax=Pseudenhygromyxa sp. WMMC2535 TaxID=2712867 RepID=UPI001595B8F9|nr:serine/threonine-protein kinase [Pseudenhygromyxa sp. WMMC2535]NVB42564.1 serine/threonine protein kinase [Pseudenhygromyxa sp. WMMC2535]
MAHQPKGPPASRRRLALDEEHSGASMSMEMAVNDDIGRTLASRYQISRIIGEGGMGVVYEAYDTQVDRDVAIKVVRSECLSDRKFLTRFRREMEVTTRLRHPSTIRVFEHGEAEDGRPYMVMELLTGESLAERLERGRIPEIEALQYARQIAESLSEAHENGIFHRDLKPDNIFIESVGVSTVVKVLDFGIAGGLDATRLTKAGEVFGTPQYMSPEQCNGLALDHRTDIYSLGCILYEMIEGRPPFSAESPMATMLKHVKSKVPTPRHCCRETVKVLMMALRKDRNKRIQDCGRFAELLGECIGAARARAEGRQPPESPLRRSANSTGPISAVNDLPTVGKSPSAPLPSGQSVVNKLVIGGLALAFVLIVGAMIFGGGDRDHGVEEREDERARKDAPTLADDPSDADELPKNRASITTNVEGARVFLDGDFQCETPCTIEVPVGDDIDHELILRKDGYIEVMGKWRPSSVTEAAPQLPDLKPADLKLELD